jgi:hypothetical protein
MSSLIGKHQFGELEEKRVTFVEKGVTKERADFLEKLLKHNGFEVLIGEDKKKNEEDPTLYIVAVSDMVFNPTIWVFQRRLKTLDGRIVTQDFWEQKTDITTPQYYESKL